MSGTMSGTMYTWSWSWSWSWSAESGLQIGRDAKTALSPKTGENQGPDTLQPERCMFVPSARTPFSWVAQGPFEKYFN
jgi:hypothetical protein